MMAITIPKFGSEVLERLKGRTGEWILAYASGVAPVRKKGMRIGLILASSVGAISAAIGGQDYYGCNNQTEAGSQTNCQVASQQSFNACEQGMFSVQGEVDCTGSPMGSHAMCCKYYCVQFYYNMPCSGSYVYCTRDSGNDVLNGTCTPSGCSAASGSSSSTCPMQ